MHSPLASLITLVETIARTQDPEAMMDTIVERLCDLMHAEVCSLYLCNPEQDTLILAATRGLSREAVGKVSLNLNEGLVGHIAASLSTLNIADAPSDDRFVYIPETHEQSYHRFMGVPLIHLRKLVGVLVVQGTLNQQFNDDEEAFLITVASQLAGTLHHLQRSGSWMSQPTLSSYERYKGVKGSSGIGTGRLWVIDPHMTLDQVEAGINSDAIAETADFHQAIEWVAEELEAGSGRLGNHLPGDLHALFGVYQMMLNSPELKQGVEEKIKQGDSAPWALCQVIREMAHLFEQSNDPYLKARSEDITNIGQRILNQLLQHDRQVTEAPDEALILCGELISITDLAEFPLKRIHGIVCTAGSSLSHTAIVANALGIPAVMAVEDLKPAKFRGKRVIVDGNRGECIVTPPDALLNEYKRMIAEEQRFIAGLDKLKSLPAETLDGFRVELLTNTGLLADATPGLERGAEGVGLYRSEIPFMIHDSFPTEEEQLRIYQKVLAAYAPKPVSMRSLDIGGDKQLPYFEMSEENPYLGWRGIRFTLDNTQLLITQIRAMLRANIANGNLKLLVPMVSRVDEMMTFRQHVEKAVDDLNKLGYPAQLPSIGMMVEVPSAMLLIPKLAPYIDFVSVGSNDLTQYLLAVDRNNPRVSALFDHLHPAVMLALEYIQKECENLNLPLSVCGEMASDPVAVLVMIALGYQSISLSAFNIPRIKLLIRSVSRAELLPILEKARGLSHESDIRALFSGIAERALAKTPD
ncbi:phosphoenolpyruvate--protein phosphotransferase [Nitrincola alkalisediminis]|nr:phosphoenolpyruvate--protein phosphotransferase [Nitrincola alkalisediminis]